MERISYHQMFMNIAREVSRRSTCCRKQVGSILVSDRQKIISCGWNGVPSGKEHCADTFSASDRFQEDFFKKHGEWSKYNELHSELNCIIHCDRDKLKTATLYTTLSPCSECAKIIIASEDIDGMDIGPKSVEEFQKYIFESKTVFWSGPLGKVEDERYSQGSIQIADLISKSGTYSVVGGGDTLAFLEKNNLVDKFSFVSVGGSALLEYLSSGELVGLSAVINSNG